MKLLISALLLSSSLALANIDIPVATCEQEAVVVVNETCAYAVERLMGMACKDELARANRSTRAYQMDPSEEHFRQHNAAAKSVRDCQRLVLTKCRGF